MAILSTVNLGTKRPLRVAAYCRVSTEEELQNNSYVNQREFFSREIFEHPDWVSAGIYGDRGKSGTSIKSRTGFLEMMKNAEKGCIDYIITKSIARFSRSTADTIHAIRKLRTKEIGIYFMEQNIDTMSEAGDFVIETLAAVAEMESASISENTKVILDLMNARGTPLRRSAYGYRKEGKAWYVIPEQALRVKLAFLMAAEGYSFTEIARKLNIFEEKDRTGRVWDIGKVRYLLTNEVYIGDILTNKHVVIWDETGRKEVKNDKLEDKYYISGHHEPIVGNRLFEMISEMCRAKKLAGQKDFKGIREARALAKKDSLLNSVRKYLPAAGGRCLKGEKK